MKKLILMTCLLALFSFKIEAQDTTKYVYCEMIDLAKALTNKTRIAIDYGQGADKVDSLKNVVQGINALSSQGWQLVSTFVMPIQAMAQTAFFEPHYIFRRKINK